jgi:hypothetical protein
MLISLTCLLFYAKQLEAEYGESLAPEGMDLLDLDPDQMVGSIYP